MNQDDDKNVTVQLDDPFEWESDKDQITEIVVQYPRVHHIRGVNLTKCDDDSDEIIKLCTKLIGKSPRFIDRISFKDMTKIIDVVKGFLSPSPTTGETA